MVKAPARNENGAQHVGLRSEQNAKWAPDVLPRCPRDLQPSSFLDAEKYVQFTRNGHANVISRQENTLP